MALRILDYRVRFWQRFLLRMPDTRKLPSVYSIVIHQGARPWKAPTAFRRLFHPHEVNSLTPNGDHVVPQFGFQLIDLPALTFEALQPPSVANAALAVMKLIDDRDPAAHSAMVLRLLEAAFSSTSQRPTVDLLLRYTFVHAQKIDIPHIQSQIDAIANPTFYHTAMTIAEQLITQGHQEGLSKGRQEGRAEGARLSMNLVLILSKRFGQLSPQIFERIAAADPDRLQHWSDVALDAQSIDEVFAEE